jgi:hypothetical protein
MGMLAGSRRRAAEHPLADVRFGRLADVRFGRTGFAATDHVAGAQTEHAFAGHAGRRDEQRQPLV